MRQLHVATLLRASEKAEIDAPLWPQRRCGHPPGAVHSHFGWQFRGFEWKKGRRGHVDSLFPINNKGERCPHFRGGALWGNRRGLPSPVAHLRLLDP